MGRKEEAPTLKIPHLRDKAGTESQEGMAGHLGMVCGTWRG